MKKLIFLILFLMIFLVSCEKTCEHTWIDANCLSPQTCKNCNISEGEPLHHSYEDGICIRCSQKDPTYLTKKEQMMKFLQNAKKEELNLLCKSLQDNVDDKLDNDIQCLFDECFSMIDKTNTIIFIR